MESTPLSFLTGRPDAASVRFDQVLYDEQSQAGSPSLNTEGVKYATEFRKQSIDLVLTDSDTMV